MRLWLALSRPAFSQHTALICATARENPVIQGSLRSMTSAISSGDVAFRMSAVRSAASISSALVRSSARSHCSLSTATEWTSLAGYEAPPFLAMSANARSMP